MVELRIEGDMLVVDVQGIHQILAIKRRIDIPLDRVRSIRADPSAAEGWFHGWRMPGTNIPGLVTSGTYFKGNERSFWDVVRKANVVVVELDGAEYDRLVVEVADPARTVAEIRERIGLPLA